MATIYSWFSSLPRCCHTAVTQEPLLRAGGTSLSLSTAPNIRPPRLPSILSGILWCERSIYMTVEWSVWARWPARSASWSSDRSLRSPAPSGRRPDGPAPWAGIGDLSQGTTPPYALELSACARASYAPLTLHTSVCCLFRAYFRPQAVFGAHGSDVKVTVAAAADLGRVPSRRSRVRSVSIARLSRFLS